jgi:uncharacterized protein (UPF0276 family)
VATSQSIVRGSIPARAGIGLRAVHHDALLSERPDVGWLEAHSENYFADGGAQVDYLVKLAEHYPLSLHGVGLSLGSTDALDREHLRRIRRLVNRFEPGLISEHVSWGSVGGVHLNDLLPLPYTWEALRHLARRVAEVQDALGRQILLENVSSYLQYTVSELAEWDFLAALVRESGCALLLDLNNIFVSSRNHGFDPIEFLAAIPRAAVHEIHLAGHTANRYGDQEILIDTHSTHVCDDVWALYDAALHRFGSVPTLIEWDTDIPALGVLVDEARKVDLRREARHGLAA